MQEVGNSSRWLPQSSMWKWLPARLAFVSSLGCQKNYLDRVGIGFEKDILDIHDSKTFVSYLAKSFWKDLSTMASEVLNFLNLISVITGKYTFVYLALVGYHRDLSWGRFCLLPISLFISTFMHLLADDIATFRHILTLNIWLPKSWMQKIGENMVCRKFGNTVPSQGFTLTVLTGKDTDKLCLKLPTLIFVFRQLKKSVSWPLILLTSGMWGLRAQWLRRALAYSLFSASCRSCKVFKKFPTTFAHTWRLNSS